ncbi:uncharacterized protein LOC142978362 [Anticarsia gemmatalis]|uniref:uncharacterized protein LOC142978362 n=1 Tax=Anticarsia gemmatalis TaxID=129554 RepID=UPI003F766A0C
MSFINHYKDALCRAFDIIQSNNCTLITLSKMFKIFFVACMLALAVAEPKPNPALLYSAYTAPVAAAYTAPVAAAYTAPLAYSAYTAPVAAYSAYPYAAPYSAAYLLK